MAEEWEPQVNLLPDPRPSGIELSNDGFIRNPHLKDGEANHAGIEKMLAMTQRSVCTGTNVGSSLSGSASNTDIRRQ